MIESKTVEQRPVLVQLDLLQRIQIRRDLPLFEGLAKRTAVGRPTLCPLRYRRRSKTTRCSIIAAMTSFGRPRASNNHQPV